MTNRWINVQSVEKQLKNLLNKKKFYQRPTYIGASIRPVFHASLKTMSAPPRFKVPFTATTNSAPNIENV